jgi:hypothetical protein
MSAVLLFMHCERKTFSDVYAMVKAAVAVLFLSGQSGTPVSIIMPLPSPRRVYLIYYLTDILSSDHVHWINETLIRALELAPPSLTISICIHVTGASATVEPFLHSNDSDVDAKRVDDHFRSGIMVLQNGKAEEKSNGSLPAIESVKLQNGRPDLPAILRDEVGMATGSMSVSGQSLSPHLQKTIMLILMLVCGSQGIVRSVRGALRFPVCSPFSVVNGGPSVTLYVESFGYA